MKPFIIYVITFLIWSFTLTAQSSSFNLNHPYQNYYQKKATSLPQCHYTDFGLNKQPSTLQIDNYKSDGTNHEYKPKSKFISTIYTFNSYGFVNDAVKYTFEQYDDSTPEDYDTTLYKYHYNNQHQIVQLDQTTYSEYSNEYLTSSEKYYYDTLGNIVKQTPFYDWGDTSNYITFEYENNKLISKNNAGLITSFNYKKGYLTEVNINDKNFAYRYDERGLLKQNQNYYTNPFIYLLDDFGSILFKEFYSEYFKHFEYSKIVYKDGLTVDYLNPWLSELVERRNMNVSLQDYIYDLNFDNVVEVENKIELDPRDSISEEKMDEFVEFRDSAYWYKDSSNSYYLYLNDIFIASKTKSFWVGNDLMVYDTIDQHTFVLKDYLNQPIKVTNDAEIIDFTGAAIWYKTTDSTFEFYHKGNKIESTEIIEKNVDGSYIISAWINAEKSNFLLANFDTQPIYKVTTASEYIVKETTIFNDQNSILWWRENDAIKAMHGNVRIEEYAKIIPLESDALLLDTRTNNYFRLINYKSADTTLLQRGYIEFENTEAIWFKLNDNSYWLYLNGAVFSHQNKWAENKADIVVIDPLTATDIYLLKDYFSIDINSPQVAFKIE